MQPSDWSKLASLKRFGAGMIGARCYSRFGSASGKI